MCRRGGNRENHAEEASGPLGQGASENLTDQVVVPLEGDLHGHYTVRFIILSFYSSFRRSQTCYLPGRFLPRGKFNKGIGWATKRMRPFYLIDLRHLLTPTTKLRPLR